MPGHDRQSSSSRSTPGKRNNRSLATPKIFVYRVGARDDKNKKRARVTFLSDLKKTRKEKRQKQVIEIIKEGSEQADKKSDKSHEKVLM